VTRLVLIAAIVLGHLGTAAAFPTGEQFDGDALTSDGGGGIAFTGAPRFASHTCAVCHTNPPGQVGIKLEANDDSLFTSGWTANTQYHLRVLLLNEHEGAQFASAGDNCGFAVTPYTPCDYNGFALEMDDDTGAPVGKLVPTAGSACVNSGTAPTDVDTRVLADGTAATHNGAHMAQTSWDLCWTAPASGTGTITAYIATVDGNGGDGTINFPNDTIGDDVAAGAVPIAEQGGNTSTPQAGGCSATDDGLGAALVIAAAMIGLRRRRRVALILAISAAAGCVHVHPRERETLARRDMKFSPDTTEDELDLHMQEAREGAEGGYGTAGGGCGCN
jgi:uncharacterized protein (TIGR03382 family)